ncbi:tRNA pseudouridine(13) synthase TruD [Solilutibacter silvestris]|uniref:tRNA pseudouridine(13) synthase TruD n=1 Tax=Solilutibacter silvestris TaxID=1645665 RepID=UPI003D337975
MTELLRAHGESVLSARTRIAPEDFRVDEIDAFEASGAGEHLLLTIEKRGLTTAEAVRRIAAWAGVPESAIGHAGLKDRHAVTRQRLSVWLPGREDPDPSTLGSEALRVIEAHRHSRKLPRGALAGNRFRLVLREIVGDRAAVEERLGAIAARGVPNYFGEQRFGRFGDNVAQALAMFAGRRVKREERSMLLSAARSELFNRVLAQRVRDGNWNAALEGDVFMLAGSHSVFGPEPLDDRIRERVATFDIDPTGPMWGRGALRTSEAVLALETEALVGDDAQALRDGLERAAMKQERRALRLRATNLQWQWLHDDALEFAFELPPGSYATSVLAELGDITDAMR